MLCTVTPVDARLMLELLRTACYHLPHGNVYIPIGRPNVLNNVE